MRLSTDTNMGVLWVPHCHQLEPAWRWKQLVQILLTSAQWMETHSLLFVGGNLNTDVYLKPPHTDLLCDSHQPLNTHLDLQHRAENEEHTQALKSWRLGFHRISKDGQSTWAELPVTADERQIEKPSEDVLNSHGPARSPDPTQEAHFSAGVTTPCVCLCVCTHSRSHSLAL